MKVLICLPAVFLFVLIYFSSSFPVPAKERPPVLAIGMPYSEVLTRAGAPTSKKIMEIKREEEWYYPGFTVLFKDGQVVNLEGSVIPQPSAAPPAVETQTARTARRQRETPPDLLRNILKELPAPAGSPGAAGPGNPGAQPQAIAPAVAPGAADGEE